MRRDQRVRGGVRRVQQLQAARHPLELGLVQAGEEGGELNGVADGLFF